ncbi:hypothetical protein ILYODFUR_022007 [Ilyodon furcidens]|uniref:Uncharacterized protein n=1 Tax=Ilyodon furcidens TaxID=33524 RepID=A0ABV0U7R0_9TELE
MNKKHVHWFDFVLTNPLEFKIGSGKDLSRVSKHMMQHKHQGPSRQQPHRWEPKRLNGETSVGPAAPKSSSWSTFICFVQSVTAANSALTVVTDAFTLVFVPRLLRGAL